jgi:hypothetical protein
MKQCFLFFVCFVFSLFVQATEIPLAIKKAKSLALKEPEKALDTFLSAIYQKGNTPVPQNEDSMMLHAGEAFQRMIETEDTYAWEIASGLLELRDISAKRGYDDPYAMNYQLLYMSCARDWSSLEDTDANFMDILWTENPLLIKFYSDQSEWNAYDERVFQGLVRAYHHHRDAQLLYSLFGYFHMQEYLEHSPSFLNALKDPNTFDRIELSFDVDSIVYFPESYRKGLKPESFFSLWSFWLSSCNRFQFNEANQVVEFMLTAKIPSELKSAYASFFRDVLLLSDKYPDAVQSSTKEKVLKKLGKLEGNRMYELLFRCDAEYVSGKVTSENLDTLQLEYAKFQKKRGFKEEQYLSYYWYQYDLKLALYAFSAGKVEQSKMLYSTVKSKFPMDLKTASGMGISWLDFVKVQLHFATLASKYKDTEAAASHAELAGKIFQLSCALMFNDEMDAGSNKGKIKYTDQEKKELLLIQHSKKLNVLYAFLKDHGGKNLRNQQLDAELNKLSNYIAGKNNSTVMVDLNAVFPWHFDAGQYASVDVCMSFLTPAEWGYAKGPFSGVAHALVDGVNQADVYEMGQLVYEYYLGLGQKNKWEIFGQGLKMDLSLDFPTRNGLFQWLAIDQFRAKILKQNGRNTESESIKARYPKVK